MAQLTFLKKLRDAAMNCSNLDYRTILRHQADEISDRLHLTYTEPTEENMKMLNSAWACGVRLLANVPDEAPPAPLAGSPEPAGLAT